MSTLQPGALLECIGPTCPGSPLMVGAVYRCLAVDDQLERCTVHADQGCRGVMVDGATPAAGFWWCERVFRPLDEPDSGALWRALERTAA